MHATLAANGPITFHPFTPPPSAAGNDPANNDTAGNDTIEVDLRSAVDYPRKPVEWLWPGRIPIGKVTLLAGDPGLGKSLVALDVAARVTNGAEWPISAGGTPGASSDGRGCSSAPACGNTSDSTTPFAALRDVPLAETLNPEPRTLNPPGSVIILSAEDDVADTIRPRLDAHGADPSRIFFLPKLADLRHDLGQLEAALDRLPGCRLIVVDPVNAYVGPSDSHFHTIVRKVLAPLADLAAKRGIAILAVTHLRKNEGAAIYRATGSMGFVAAARAVWTICRDKSDPRRNLLLPVKNNLGPLGDGLAYTIESHPQINAPLLRWQPQAVTTPAEEALKPQHKPRGPEAEDRRNAGEWLKTALADGPRESWLVLREGKQNGFGERTVQRALHAIGGKTKKDGYYNGWLWSLPRGEIQDQPREKQRNQDDAGPAVENTVEKPVAFDETCRLRENAEENGRANSAAAAPPPSPDSFAPPKPPTVAESIRFLNRLDAHRNGKQPPRGPREPREPATNENPNSPTGNPLLDRMLAEFRKPIQPRPEAVGKQSGKQSRQPTTDHGPRTTNKKSNKKSARSHSRFPTGTNS